MPGLHALFLALPRDGACRRRGFQQCRHDNLVGVGETRLVAGNGANADALLDGVSVTDRLRAHETSEMASRVASVAAVREALVSRQRAFRQPPGLVADGRDMGTVIFPDAALKIFLTASAEARAEGGLKENAEYHAAREQQGFIEGRIKDIEAKLSNATIIDVTQLEQSGKVVFGVTVDVADEETGDELTYQIVGDDEADIKNNMISISSPIARALIGKEEGDIAEVDTPGGIRALEIIEVRYL